MHQYHWLGKKGYGATALLLLLLSASLQAEVYRYQDANGKWRFSDKPPAGEIKTDVMPLKESIGATTDASKKKGGDLAAELLKKLHPVSNIEKATLAVVKIETLVGSGSGFFIADNGYLVTNKHVVRPASVSGNGHSITEQLDKHDEQLKKAKSAIDERQRELDRYSSQIQDYEKRMASASRAEQAQMQEELDYHKGRYKTALQDYQQAKVTYDKLNATLVDQKGAVNLSQDANRFKITFADESVQEAELVEVSEEQDLALLRIVGNYKTPFLITGNRLSVPQGGEVFAIGSPMGMNDHVSKGVVSRQEKERIVIDAKIWPGNSGGALVDPAGMVIGVNTAIYLADGTLGSQAFAYAIPIDVVQQAFARYLSPPATQR